MTNNVIKKVYKNGVEYQIYGSAGAAGAGDVSGPASATNGHLAVFDGTTGKVIKDGGAVPSTSDCVKTSGDQTIAGTKTFSTSPVVPSKTTDATNTGTAIATEAQVYKKQDSLTTQTAYTSKGTATKVPTITTNTLGQVTGITETSITFPVTSVNGSTGAVTGLQSQHSTLTLTLAAANWSSKSITVSATGVTASNTVFVAPAPSSILDYADGGVYCSGQGSGTLTFECDTEPTNDITVNVVIFN